MRFNKRKFFKFNLTKSCTYEQDLLEDVDSVLYLDSDTLFLTSPERIWTHFNLMNESQLVAASLHNEENTPGWYHSFSSRIPFYGNSGKPFCLKRIFLLVLFFLI